MFLSVAVFVFLMLNRIQLNVRASWSCLYCLYVRGIWARIFPYVLVR